MIIRRRHTANYTTIGNVLFEDERLAADEVGILAYLLSRPHDWEVRRPALMRRWKMGREAIKRIITNLVRTGWCRPEKTRLPGGTFFFIYEIRDEPGPELSDEEVRRALSLVSSEATPTDADDVPPPDGPPEPAILRTEPPTGYPSLVHPSPGDPYVADISIQTTDLPRTDSTQKLEREHARAKEKHATNLAEFKRRWPTAVTDDQTRVDNAWHALTLEEGDAALGGIAPFLDELKRNGRSHPPAGFNYLGQKRWTLLKQAVGGAPTSTTFAADSAETRAVRVLHDIAGALDAFHRFILRGNTMYWRGPVTPKLLALSAAPKREDWVTLDRQQAAAWDAMLGEALTALPNRARLREGAHAPWPWPPRKDGTLSQAGPPDTLMTDQDIADFK